MFFSVALATMLCSQTDPRPFPLLVGDPAPPLRVERFLKGEPVGEFRKGTVYVVEFWATWCVPCRESFPRLTELQKRYGNDVRVIGVSVWEPDPAAVEPFVKQCGDKMGYTLAADKVEGVTTTDRQTRSRESVTKGLTSKGYMVDSGWHQSGIPCAFVIDREGRLAWAGEPADLDQPLADIVAGRFDLARAAASYRKKMDTEVWVRRERTAAREAQKAGRFDEALAHTEKILALGDSYEGDMLFKFGVLLKDKKQPDAAVSYLRSKAAGVNWSTTMNMAAALAYDTPELRPEHLKAGLEVCQIALTKIGKDHTWPLMVMARLHHRLGEKQQALACVDRALVIAKNNDKPKFVDERKVYETGRDE